MTTKPTPLRSAIDIVAVACNVARNVQQQLNGLGEITKDDKSPVSVADFAVQAIIQLGLADAEASPLIVGEEKAKMLRDPQRKPVLDAVVKAVSLWRSNVTAQQVLDAIDACDHDGTGEAICCCSEILLRLGIFRASVTMQRYFDTAVHCADAHGVVDVKNTPGKALLAACLSIA